MKKIKLLIAAVAILGLFSSSTVSADGFSPGEGLYLGPLVGGGMGFVQPKVVTEGNVAGTGDNNNTVHEGGVYQVNDGGLALEGMEYGGWVGYGYKMGDIYAGIEGEMVASDLKFKISADTAIELGCGAVEGGATKTCQTLQSIEAEKKWTGGLFGRLGFYINKDTLLAFRGGVLVSKFDVKTTGSTDYSETFYGGGPSFGASMESRLAAIDPNLSFRIGGVYTDYLTASVFGIGNNKPTRIEDRTGHDSEVTGGALSVRAGLTYSFFDVNSLF